MSSTPILDRRAPLPPLVPPRPGMTVVVVVWTIVLLLLTAGIAFGYPPSLRHWLFTTVHDWVDIDRPWSGIVFITASTVAVSLVMVAIHEGGYALCGLAAGFRFKSIRVGPLLFDRSSGLTWRRGPGNPFAGVAVVVPDTIDRLVPPWLESGDEKQSVTVRDLPLREHIDVPVREQLIVELYSK